MRDSVVCIDHSANLSSLVISCADIHAASLRWNDSFDVKGAPGGAPPTPSSTSPPGATDAAAETYTLVKPSFVTHSC
jgi:hypothetical protein